MPLKTTTVVSFQPIRSFSDVEASDSWVTWSCVSIEDSSLKMTDCTHIDHASGLNWSPYASKIRRRVWMAPGSRLVNGQSKDEGLWLTISQLQPFIRSDGCQSKEEEHPQCSVRNTTVISRCHLYESLIIGTLNKIRADREWAGSAGYKIRQDPEECYGLRKSECFISCKFEMIHTVRDILRSSSCVQKW